MLAVVRPPGLAVCWQLEGAHLLTRGEQPRDAAWTSLIPVEACRPLSSEGDSSPFRRLSHTFGVLRPASPLTVEATAGLRGQSPRSKHHYQAPRRVSRTAFSISRFVSRSRRAERLSWSFLPRASPISSFARPLLKYRRIGMSVNPRSATLPVSREISLR